MEGWLREMPLTLEGLRPLSIEEVDLARATRGKAPNAVAPRGTSGAVSNPKAARLFPLPSFSARRQIDT